MFGFHKNNNAAPPSHLSAGLRDVRQRFEVIINSMDYGVVLIDDQQTIQMINPSAAALCEWRLDEANGINVNNVVQLVDSKGQPYKENNPFVSIFQSKQPIRDNTAFLLTHSRKQIPISLSLSPMLDDKQQVTAAVAVFRDVTQERSEEQQRADFISTASHEMRTPVAAIEGYLALALNDKVATIDSRARDYLDKAHASTQHLGRLFQDLLTSAKAEDGRLTSHPAVVELGAFLEQVTNDLRFTAQKKGLTVEFVVGSNETINATGHAGGSDRVIRPLYYVFADADRLREAITNLADNAIKYTEEGKISIGLTGDQQVVQCYIRDTGSGIPAEDVPHLFQKFYRVDNSTTRVVGGTGLGLFISRKIIELYNGRIWVESEIGKGSSFYINLPRLSTEKVTQLQAQAASDTTLKPINSLTST